MTRSRLMASTTLSSAFHQMRRLVECRMLIARVEDLTRRAGIA